MAFASDLGKRKGRCVGVKMRQKLGPGRMARWGSHLGPVARPLICHLVYGPVAVLSSQLGVVGPLKRPREA